MKVCVLPAFPKDDILKKIEIKYPSDKTPKSFLFNKRTYEIFELIKSEEKFRSWFIGDFVVQDGSLFLITKVDLTFILLNFLNQSDAKFNDIYHIVNENDALFNCLTKNKEINLEVVCDLKNVDDNIYLKYNSEKVIKFLKFKIFKLNEFLKANAIQVSENYVKVSNFVGGKQEEASESDYNSFSISLIADYIPKYLVDKLFELYNIKEEKLTPSKEKQDKKRKIRSDEPVDDYSNLIPNDSSNKKQKVLTRTEKQLSKVDTSKMKSITSFFQKKTSCQRNYGLLSGYLNVDILD